MRRYLLVALSNLLFIATTLTLVVTAGAVTDPNTLMTWWQIALGVGLVAAGITSLVRLEKNHHHSQPGVAHAASRCRFL